MGNCEISKPNMRDGACGRTNFQKDVLFCPKTDFPTELSQLGTLIEVVLPFRQYDIKSTIDLIFWIQDKNHRKKIEGNGG